MSEVGDQAPQRLSAAERVARRREAYEAHGPVYKAVFVGTGLVITLAGVALLALPGPAFVIIPIGLAMLAVRFTWAERALVKALEQAERAQEKARNTTPLQKALGIAGTVLAIAAGVAAASLWDIPLLPV
ncbi:MAG: PGPGW domain-containing protein [Actinomycetota bacterium]|nr:PGPGW domain-containing protein [Actinomycetota bacterium]